MARRFLLLFTFFAVHLSMAGATHLTGGEITYRNIDSNRYVVYVTLYRDCRGVALTNVDTMASVMCKSGGKKVRLNMQLQRITDISVFCDTASSPCNPSNTINTGDGTEKHVYVDTIDFSDTLFSSLKSCGKLIIQANACCRNSSITTGAANTFFYNYAELNLADAPQNSSPVILSDPILKLCCNQPVYYSMNAQDTVDGDSLSYAFSYGLSRLSQQILYTSPYTYKQPFTIYDPFRSGMTYPNANPPIGMYLDPQTGDLIFTPTSCSEVTTMVIEISEWRKDSTGKPVKIGIVRRDMTHWVSQCQGNNPPILNGPYSYSVCEGYKISFKVTTDDKVFVPPPPAATPDPDTVSVSWINTIKGATIELKDTFARLQSAQFTWTPTIGTTSGSPYSFTLFADDNNCPRPGRSSRVYQVRVKETPTGMILRSDSICGVYHYEVTGLKSGTNYFGWQILDSAGNIVFDQNKAFFGSTGNYRSTKQKDRLEIRSRGKYIIRLDITLYTGCTKILLDTIDLNRSQIELFSRQDSVFCDATGVRLTPDLIDTSKFTQFLWNGVPSDTMAHLNVPLADTFATHRVSAYSSDGCIQIDSIHVARAFTPWLYPLHDSALCVPFTYTDTARLKYPDNLYTPFVQWENGDTNFGRSFNAQGKYYFTATNQCGSDTSPINVFGIMRPDLKEISSDTLCMPFADTVQLVDNSDSGRTVRTYTWENGFKGKTRVLTQEGLYRVIAKDRCGSDTVQFTRTGDPLPALQDISNDTLCLPFKDTIQIVDLSDSGWFARMYTWENGFKGKERVLDQEGNYQVVAQSWCGTDTVRFNRTGDMSPVLQAISSDTLCLPFTDTIELVDLTDSGKVSRSFSWENGSTQAIRILTDTGRYFGVVLNQCGTDTVFFSRYAFTVPHPDLGPDTIINKPFTLTLDAGPIGRKYRWNTTDSTQAIQVSDWGRYSVQITDTCGTYNDTIDVGYCNAGFYYQKDTSATYGVLLIDTSSGPDLEYVWDFGDGDTSHQKTPVHTYSTFGKYLLCLTVSNDYCTSTFCDSLGMDSTGKLLKEGAFGIRIIHRSSVGIDDDLQHIGTDFRIYPVPNSGAFTLDLKGMNSSRVDVILIYDYLGRAQAIRFEKVGPDKISVQMTDPAQGMYYLFTVSDGLRSQPVPLMVR